MILMCWSQTVEFKMATWGYLGFTLKATKPAKQRFMGPLYNIQLLIVILYNSPA